VTPDVSSPWLTAREAAAHAHVSARTIYQAVSAGRLRAARIGFGKALRFRREWVDSWLEASAAPVDTTKDRRWA
jgi:excisionase family DNA binding protein